MDVDRNNLAHLLPQIISSIDLCDFIAIDTEYSGPGSLPIISKSDSHAIRFAKYIDNHKDYWLIQLGLSCFTSKPKDSTVYYCYNYNFYLLPSFVEETKGPTTFKVASVFAQSTLQFHRKHGFDFQKWIDQGIVYGLPNENINRNNLQAITNNGQDEKVDMSYVIRYLIQSGKPIVGHNCLMDMIYITNHMITSLNDNLDQFKSLLRSNFPVTYDTKLIVDKMHNYFPTTSLEAIYSITRKPPFGKFKIIVVNKQQQLNKEASWHNAGFDSLVTGNIFLELIDYLQLNENQTNEEPSLRHQINWLNLETFKGKYFMLCNRLKVFDISNSWTKNSDNDEADNYKLKETSDTKLEDLFNYTSNESNYYPLDKYSDKLNRNILLTKKVKCLANRKQRNKSLIPIVCSVINLAKINRSIRPFRFTDFTRMKKNENIAVSRYFANQ